MYVRTPRRGCGRVLPAVGASAGSSGACSTRSSSTSTHNMGGSPGGLDKQSYGAETAASGSSISAGCSSCSSSGGGSGGSSSVVAVAVAAAAAAAPATAAVGTGGCLETVGSSTSNISSSSRDAGAGGATRSVPGPAAASSSALVVASKRRQQQLGSQPLPPPRWPPAFNVTDCTALTPTTPTFHTSSPPPSTTASNAASSTPSTSGRRAPSPPQPSSSQSLPPPRPSPSPSPLPPPPPPPPLLYSCRPDWAEGRAVAGACLYGSAAVRLGGVVERPARLAEALAAHARWSGDAARPPRLSAAWRCQPDTHRFLCHCEVRQALQGPYQLRCPDTSPLTAADCGDHTTSCTGSSSSNRSGATAGSTASLAAAAATAGGDSGAPATAAAAAAAATAAAAAGLRAIRPRLCDALRCADCWQQHRLLLQLDVCRLTLQPTTFPRCAYGGDGVGSGGGGGGGGGRGCWTVDMEPVCGGEWMAACTEILEPVLSWIRNDLLGSYWFRNPSQQPLALLLLQPPAASAGGSSGSSSDCGGGTAAEQAATEGPGGGEKEFVLQPPYAGGVLGLEWAGAGALLPLRCDPNQDRVIVQLRGCRRVLLVPPEAAVAAPGGLAPFPLLHPYDCYSQPAVAHTLVMETPGVDVARAREAVLAAWPQTLLGGGSGSSDITSDSGSSSNGSGVRGASALLQPGDALYVPAGWFLHSELLPPAQPATAATAAAVQGSSGTAGTGGGSSSSSSNSPFPALLDNLALVLTLAPAEPPPAPPSPPATASGGGSSSYTTSTSTSSSSSGTARRVLPARPPSAHAAALQVCRLLEGWALAAEVAPGPELTRVLSGMADYHEERRALEREQRRQQQRQQQQQQLVRTAPVAQVVPRTRLGKQSRGGEGQPQTCGLVDGSTEAAAPAGPAVTDISGTAAAASSPAGIGGGAPVPLTSSGAASAAGTTTDTPGSMGSSAGSSSDSSDSSSSDSSSNSSSDSRHPTFMQRLISHSLHPTFNTFTPAGRVMTDLYDMAVRHVAVGGVARTALAAVGRAVGQTVGQAGCKAVGAVRGSSGMHDAEKARVGFVAGHAASRVEACQEGHTYETESGGKGCGGGDEGGNDDTAAPEDDDDGLVALLRLVVGERLNRPTDWVNRLCRDADVVRDARAVVWYDDTRSEAERRFPELFRLQIAGKHAAARQTSLRPAALTHTAPLLLLPSAAGGQQPPAAQLLPPP